MRGRQPSETAAGDARRGNKKQAAFLLTQEGQAGAQACPSLLSCLRCKRVANNKHAPGSLPCGVTGKDA